jgi:exopolysaccharide biosynthesis protein
MIYSHILALFYGFSHFLPSSLTLSSKGFAWNKKIIIKIITNAEKSSHQTTEPLAKKRPSKRELYRVSETEKQMQIDVQVYSEGVFNIKSSTTQISRITISLQFFSARVDRAKNVHFTYRREKASREDCRKLCNRVM